MAKSSQVDSRTNAGSNSKLALGLVLLWWAILALFYAVPELDIATSSIFFNNGFLASQSPFLQWMRETLYILPYTIGPAVLGWLLIRFLRGRGFSTEQRTGLSMTLTLLFWPLLIVNGVFKEHWGRPRPRDTTLFGGEDPFVRAGEIADYCASNCSFISGEAASAGWLACLIMLVGKPWRLLAALALVPASITMAGLRVAFGAHYLSDAALAYVGAIASFATISVLVEWLFASSRAK